MQNVYIYFIYEWAVALINTLKTTDGIIIAVYETVESEKLKLFV